MVADGAFSHKINCFPYFEEILNLEGHLNRFIGSTVTAILVNGWILPSGGVASGRVCACSLRSRLVSGYIVLSNIQQGFHGYPALNRFDNPLNGTPTSCVNIRP